MIYKFRIQSEEVDDFVREIEIDGDQTFLELHNKIQESIEYDSSQMASFYQIDDDGQRGKEIALFEMNSEEDDNLNVVAMDVAMVREFVSEDEPSLLYLFDFFSNRSLDVVLVDIHKPQKGTEYPICSLAVGDAPQQIIMDAESFEELDLEGVNLSPNKNSSEYDFLDEFDDDFEGGPEFENLDDFEDIL